MNIKKFKATTENEAILMAREELGPEAIVLNIKTIKPKGIFKLFKKSSVELTAAVDENIVSKAEPENTVNQKNKQESSSEFGRAFGSEKTNENTSKISDTTDTQNAQNAIEEKINLLSRLLEQQMVASEENTQDNEADKDDKKERATDSKKDETAAAENDNNLKDTKSKLIKLIKKQLIDNEVAEDYVDAIIDEFNDIADKQPVDNVLVNIYQKIVLKLGEIKPLTLSEEKPKVVFFVGNTGVGKTTTLAKIASKFKLDEKAKIAMISVDTYRIAAIEQMKTYANILNAPSEVVYTPEEMKNAVEKYKDYDLVFVDTAGRSHKNEEQKKDLKEIIDSVSDYEKEIYLVLSISTKYKDLLNITETYGELFDFKLIFTKLDETREIGNIVNLKLDTGKSLSYVTWGQNVPEDIGVVNPQIIAKKLLGGTD